MAFVKTVATKLPIIIDGIVRLAEVIADYLNKQDEKKKEYLLGISSNLSNLKSSLENVDGKLDKEFSKLLELNKNILNEIHLLNLKSENNRGEDLLFRNHLSESLKEMVSLLKDLLKPHEEGMKNKTEDDGRSAMPQAGPYPPQGYPPGPHLPPSYWQSPPGYPPYQRGFFEDDQRSFISSSSYRSARSSKSGRSSKCSNCVKKEQEPKQSEGCKGESKSKTDMQKNLDKGEGSVRSNRSDRSSKCSKCSNCTRKEQEPKLPRKCKDCSNKIKKEPSSSEEPGSSKTERKPKTDIDQLSQCSGSSHGKQSQKSSRRSKKTLRDHSNHVYYSFMDYHRQMTYWGGSNRMAQLWWEQQAMSNGQRLYERFESNDNEMIDEKRLVPGLESLEISEEIASTEETPNQQTIVNTDVPAILCG